MSAREILDLTDEKAAAPARVGGKAAALARATAAGLPALPGFVVTTGDAGPDRELLLHAWRRVSEGGRLSVVVRSSGVAEDAANASLAGQFRTELDVRGPEAFLEAVERVLDSAGPSRPAMAVLVQPFRAATTSGIAFALDPTTGKRRLTVAATAGGPDQLVSGAVTGTFFHLSRSGRVRREPSADDDALLSRRQLRGLAALVRAVGRLFGAPQDVEWAIVDDELVLFQSRPVTTAATARGRVLGPGPVAETFPEPLAPLEVDLWVEPLRHALTEAVVLSGAATRRRADAAPVVDVVDGWVVADLGLLDARPMTGVRTLLNPLAGLRKLRTSWRVGRLRPALPGLARDTMTGADALLADVPALDQLSDRDLLAVLESGRQALTAVHGYEVLIGMLLREDAGGGSALHGAVQLARAARLEGLDDEAAVARDPAVLALTSPRICRSVRLPVDLPAEAPGPGTSSSPGIDADAPAVPVDSTVLLREALRLRARWLQELGSRTAAELGLRLAERGILTDWAEIRTCRLQDLRAWRDTGAAPSPFPDGEPTSRARALPAAFRLDAGRHVVPVRSRAAKRGAAGVRGLPAGPGVATGTVWNGQGTAPPDAVLVVRTLAPDLAGLLPQLAGLVAETGSPLAHLAILAREHRLPTVVAVADALDRFPAGSTVRVDGGQGTVDGELVDRAPATADGRR